MTDVYFMADFLKDKRGEAYICDMLLDHVPRVGEIVCFDDNVIEEIMEENFIVERVKHSLTPGRPRKMGHATCYVWLKLTPIEEEILRQGLR